MDMKLTDVQRSMVEENLKLVRFVLRKEFHGGKNFSEDYDDLEQIGRIGLIKAVKGYDTNRGTTFTTYAYRAICGEYLRYLRSQKAAIRRANTDTASLDAPIPGTERLMFSDIMPCCGDSPEDTALANDLWTRAWHIAQQLQAEDIFGLLTGRYHTQNELANKLQLSQAQISRLKSKLCAAIRAELGECKEACAATQTLCEQ